MTAKQKKEILPLPAKGGEGRGEGSTSEPLAVRESFVSQYPLKAQTEWPKVRVGDICDAVNGRAFKSTEWREAGIPIIRIQNLKDREAPFNYFDGDLTDAHRVRSGDLLFAWSGTPGTSFGAHIWSSEDGALNQHIFNIRFDRTAIDVRYLCYALNQNAVPHGTSHLVLVSAEDTTPFGLEQSSFSDAPFLTSGSFAVGFRPLDARTNLFRTPLDFALFAGPKSLPELDPQKQRNCRAVALLQSWLNADEKEVAEHQETLKYLVKALDEDRLSSRKLFP
jgi:hypothetical protein